MMRATLLSLLLLVGCAFDVEPSGEIVGGNGNGNGGGNGGNGDPPEPTVSYALDIQPLFTQECTICHGGAGNYSVESYTNTALTGRVIPGNPDASILIRRLDGTEPPQMPLDAPALTMPEIDRIRQWITEGALDN